MNAPLLVLEPGRWGRSVTKQEEAMEIDKDDEDEVYGGSGINEPDAEEEALEREANVEQDKEEEEADNEAKPSAIPDQSGDMESVQMDQRL